MKGGKHRNGRFMTSVYRYDPVAREMTCDYDGGNVRLLQAYDRSQTGRLETKATDAGVWKYGYDLTDQVTNAVLSASASDGAWGYAYDAMGNRKTASELGELSAYSVNRLNQYTLISNHVNHVNPVQISLSYDLNGNMTWDGTNAYFWDLQNQLILVSNAQYQVASAYDAMGRRVRKEVSVWDGQLTAYRSQSTVYFFYDGWNLVREIQYSRLPTFHSSTHLYTWGNDLSGSLQGAGGVGGLLAVLSSSPNSLQPNSLTASYSLYDHNGNVERYVSRSGTTVAAFQYDAFGNTISETFTQSGNNAFTHFRFSTKYWDNEVGLYYYGYRFYRPGLGRWVNRDPYEENGGENIVMYVGNNCMNIIDKFGLFSFRPSECRETCKENTRSNFSPYRIYIGPLSPTDAATWDAVLLFADVLSAMPTGIKPSDIASWISSNIVVPTHEIADKLKDLLTQRIPWDVYLLYTVNVCERTRCYCIWDKTYMKEYHGSIKLEFDETTASYGASGFRVGTKISDIPMRKLSKQYKIAERTVLSGSGTKGLY